MRQTTDQFHRPLQGVKAMEAMVADVQYLPAKFAEVALDIEYKAMEVGIVRPKRTHGNLSLLLGCMVSLSYTASETVFSLRSFR